MVLLFENGFSGWGQFLQSFCRSTREYVISLVLLQKLCKNCPHPEKLQSLIQNNLQKVSKRLREVLNLTWTNVLMSQNKLFLYHDKRFMWILIQKGHSEPVVWLVTLENHFCDFTIHFSPTSGNFSHIPFTIAST